MTDSSDHRLAVLQTLRLKGRADTAALAGALGLDVAVVEATTADLLDGGLARPAATALRLTDDGRAELARLLAEERKGVDLSAVRAIYERFCTVNDSFKALMRDWQMVDEATPNDHSDAAYDAAVVSRLGEIDAALRPELTAAVAEVARLSSYGERLERALGRVRDGDHSWVSKPIIDSYHTVWFELHEELIGAAGLTRQEEAASGRAS